MIVAVPAVTVVIIPVVVPMFATAVLLLLQVPPPEFERVVVAPRQIAVVPEIAPGSGFTVIVLIAVQPVPSVYVITVVPDRRPETTPAPVTDATALLLLLQVPPPVLVNVMDELTHTVDNPDIAVGKGFTVVTIRDLQPVASVYVIEAVPGRIPDITPVLKPAVATVVLPLVHVPPPALVSVVAIPTHTCAVPDIAPGVTFTVKGNAVTHPVGRV